MVQDFTRLDLAATFFSSEDLRELWRYSKPGGNRRGLVPQQYHYCGSPCLRAHAGSQYCRALCQPFTTILPTCPASTFRTDASSGYHRLVVNEFRVIRNVGCLFEAKRLCCAMVVDGSCTSVVLRFPLSVSLSLPLCLSFSYACGFPALL